MRFQSKKQRAAYDEHREAREDFLAEYQWTCAVCNHRGVVHVHEITNGPNRMRGFGERAAWLPACNVCNCDVLTDKLREPLAKQLARKLLLDPAYFNLGKIRLIFGIEGRPVPVVVTEAEVLEAARLLLIERNVV